MILVDEYDKPILKALRDGLFNEKFRDQLKDFYSVLKTHEQCIKFAFITGVSRFRKLSTLSDLDNLHDISMDQQYADICGITEKELQFYFEESISELSALDGTSDADTLAKLKEQYGGYHFLQNSDSIYNPFSLLNAFSKLKFDDYWYMAVDPSFLIRLLKETQHDLTKIDDEQLSSQAMGSMDSVMRNPIPALYQCGYLTITGYDEGSDTYHLGFPNKEVHMSFLQDLLSYYLFGRLEKYHF